MVRLNYIIAAKTGRNIIKLSIPGTLTSGVNDAHLKLYVKESVTRTPHYPPLSIVTYLVLISLIQNWPRLACSTAVQGFTIFGPANWMTILRLERLGVC